MASMPREPSDPAPERITPIAPGPWTSASEQRNASIERCGPPAGRPLDQPEMPVGDRHRHVRGDDVGTVCLDRHPVGRLHDRDGGCSAEQLGEHAVVPRVEMLDEHVRQSRICREITDQAGKRLEPACRGADADDGRGGRGRRRLADFAGSFPGRSFTLGHVTPLATRTAMRSKANKRSVAGRVSSTRAPYGPSVQEHESVLPEHPLGCQTNVHLPRGNESARDAERHSHLSRERTWRFDA